MTAPRFARAPSAQKTAPAAEARMGARERLRALAPTRPSGLGAVEAALSAPGALLPERERREMEARFRRDFSAIRIHADPLAGEAARELGAEGFALGRHIVIDSALGPLDMPHGRALLAHELAHTAQQAAAPAPETTHLAPSLSVHETEAVIAANAERPPRLTPTSPGIALSSDGAAKPSGGSVTGAQVFLDPPTIILFNSSGGPIAAPLQVVHIRPGRYQIRVAVKAAPSPGSGKSMKWRTVLMEPASADDSKRMGNAQIRFSVGLGKIDPMTLFGAKAVTIPLIVYGKVGELPAADPNAPALPMPDQDISQADSDAPAAGDMKVESEPKENPDKPREITVGDEDGHGKAAEIDPEKLRIQPAYGASLEGPEYGSAGGKTIYSMNLRYDDAAGLAGKMFEAANPVNYLWQMFEPGRAVQNVQKLASAKEQFGHVNREIAEDTENAREDQRRAVEKRDAEQFAAGLLAETLEPASSIVQNVGATFNFIADATDPQNWSREVVWPNREGALVLRVVAQPVDRPQEDGTILRHRPSIGTKTVIIKTAAHAAVDAYRQSEDALKQANENADKATDPIEKRLWSRRAAELETFYGASVKDYLDQKLMQIEQDIRDAELLGDKEKIEGLKQQRETLQKQLKLAANRSDRFKGEVYRPTAFIVSEVTGDTYPLLLQISYFEPKTEGGTFTAEISDVTSPGGRDYTGVGADPILAAQAAAFALASGNDYGRGKILFKMPTKPPFDGRSTVLPNTPRGDALARQRLHDLVTVVGTVASLAGPEIGLAAAALGGAVAADDLYVRYKQKGEFDWKDPDNINDMATVFVSVATLGGAGLQHIGKLQAARSGSTITLRLGGAVSNVGELVGHAQMISATVDMVDQLAQLKKNEAAGKIDPLTARRQRAQILNSAIQMGAALALGHGGEEEPHGDVAGKEPPPHARERPGRGVKGEGERAPGRREPPPHETGEGRGEPRPHETAEGRRRPVRERGEVAEPPADRAEPAGAPNEPALLAEARGARPSENRESVGAREGRVGEPGAPPREDPAPLGANPSHETAPSARSADPGVVTELPYASVISDLGPGDDRRAYENVIRDQSHLEAAIVEDVATGERFVIQGGLWEDRHGNLKLDEYGRPQHVVDFRVILNDPEFAGRTLDLVEHYHPGKIVTDRLASPMDFDHVTHDMRMGKRPHESVTSTIRYHDPATGEPRTSTFEYRPGEKKPYFIEYQATDGSTQKRAFRDDPWLPGSDYQLFVERFTGLPTDTVPESLADRERPTLRPGARAAEGMQGASEAPTRERGEGHEGPSARAALDPDAAPSSEPPTDPMRGRGAVGDDRPPAGANPAPTAAGASPTPDAAATASPAPTAPAAVDPATAVLAAPATAAPAAATPAAATPAAAHATAPPATGAPAAAAGAIGAPAKTSVDAANVLISRYAGRLIAPGDSLSAIIDRVRARNMRVDGRAAASELAAIMRMLHGGTVNGVAVAAVEILPPTNLQRTPDLVLHLADGTTTRQEIRTATSAPRGLVNPIPGRGGVGTALAARGPGDIDAGRIAGAIIAKAKDTPSRRSQLTAPLAGVPAGGTITINVTQAPADAAMVDAAIASAAPRLGLHVERVEVLFLAPRASPGAPLLRDARTYVRQPNGSYQKVP